MRFIDSVLRVLCVCRDIAAACLVIEADCYGFLGARLGLEALHRIKPEESGENVGREAAYGDIVFHYGIVVFYACGADAVFGAFELYLQVFEVFVGFEVGVCLMDGVDVYAEGAVCGFKLGHVGALAVRSAKGLYSVLCSHQRVLCLLYGGSQSAGAHSGDVGQGAAFVFGVTLDGVHQVGDEVETTLV